MTFNEADQPTQEVVKRSEYHITNGWQLSQTVETNEVRYDKRGNLWADGKRVFNYDAYNRLTGVWARSTETGATIVDKGDPIAAFTYDGYGHRLTARYNSTKPETDQTTLDDDSVDIYSYDHLWRIRTVTEATHTQEGWTSFVREQWFYHTGSDPTSYKIGSDAPVMRRIDLNGDGIFDETQNFVTDRQGSVVGVLGDAVPVDVNNESLGMKPGPVIAKVRYDTYGVPTICDPADIDRDGVVDIADVALYCTYWNAWHASSPTSTRYKEILDYNRDGVVDANDPCTSSNADYAAFTTRAGLVMTEVVPDVKDVVGNLPLYAGYWWDAQLEMYHVRHRVYRPEWGKWIQRDPLGYAAGWNLYEYVGGEPWREIDPSGLLTSTQGWGLVKAIGGLIETIVGVTLAIVTSPTVVGTAIGVGVAAHGIDTMVAGLRQLATGEETRTFTSEHLVQPLLQLFGMGPTNAELVAEMMDALIGMLTVFINPAAGAGGVAKFASTGVLVLERAASASKAEYVLRLGIAIFNSVVNGAAKAGSKSAASKGSSSTGQNHHAVSKKVERAARTNPNLSGVTRKSGPVFQAKDLASHYGYDKWHRAYDNELVEKILSNPNWTKEDFFKWLQKRYAKPDLKSRFPNQLWPQMPGGCEN